MKSNTHPYFKQKITITTNGSIRFIKMPLYNAQFCDQILQISLPTNGINQILKEEHSSEKLKKSILNTLLKFEQQFSFLFIKKMKYTSILKKSNNVENNSLFVNFG
jgi:hypothetical protein